MDIGTRDSILAAKDLNPVKVDVPEWNCTLYLRMLTGTERDAFEALFVDIRTGRQRSVPDNVRSRLLVQVVSDAQGNRLFVDNEILALGAKSAAVLDRLFTIACAMNGLSERDVEDLEKNLPSALSGASGSS